MIISNPKRPLDRAVETTKVDHFCTRIAPYLIVIFSVLLIALAFAVLIKYGGAWFGTEANHYYNGGLI